MINGLHEVHCEKGQRRGFARPSDPPAQSSKNVREELGRILQINLQEPSTRFLRLLNRQAHC